MEQNYQVISIRDIYLKQLSISELNSIEFAESVDFVEDYL